MILGYRPARGRDDAYYFGKDTGADIKFIRVVCGAALPVLDRVKGAAVIVAENYRVTAPASWKVLDITVGEWPEVENGLAQFRQDLKFNHAIVEADPIRDVIRRMRGMQWGMNEIPLTTYVAPFYASSEVGRSKVNEFVKENRLLVPERVQRIMELEVQAAALALQYAVCWMEEWKALYVPIKKPHAGGRILGVVGLE